VLNLSFIHFNSNLIKIWSFLITLGGDIQNFLHVEDSTPLSSSKKSEIDWFCGFPAFHWTHQSLKKFVVSPSSLWLPLIYI
jgi:hypothetical protein